MAHSYSYTYDPAGNRLTATDNLASTTTTYTYDVANQMTASEDPSGTTAYEYDGAGNQTKVTDPASQVTTYTWDDENRRTKVEQPNGDVTTSTYNGDGLRIRKQVPSGADMRYVWDGSRYLMREDPSTGSKFRWTYKPTQYGNLVSERHVDDGETFFYHFDGLGSTRQLTKLDEGVINTYEYDAFGKLISGSGSAVNPFTWIGRLGYYYDSGTSDYYVRARTYSPGQSRWLSRDPIGFIVGNNLYRYVNNAPTGLVDPSGLVEEPAPQGYMRWWWSLTLDATVVVDSGMTAQTVKDDV